MGGQQLEARKDAGLWISSRDNGKLARKSRKEERSGGGSHHLKMNLHCPEMGDVSTDDRESLS